MASSVALALVCHGLSWGWGLPPPLRPSGARTPASRMPLQAWGSFCWEAWGLGPSAPELPLAS